MSGLSDGPVTIAFARVNCTGVQVHCPAGHMSVIGFERFKDDEVVPDLVNRHRFVCLKCGRPAIATRPDYPKMPGAM